MLISLCNVEGMAGIREQRPPQKQSIGLTFVQRIFDSSILHRVDFLSTFHNFQDHFKESLSQ